jgi:hypothetical protein
VLPVRYREFLSVETVALVGKVSVSVLGV